MLHVENMTREDFEFAVSLTDTMKWDMAEEDFDFNMELEPKGCFVLFDNSERIGVVTTTSFGRVAWLGNLIVTENYRRKGAGALLAKHAIGYLKGRKVKTVALYSYMNAVQFYHKLGFKDGSEYVVLQGTGHPSRGGSRAEQAVKSDIQKILHFDSLCLGFSRAKLLRPLLQNSNNLAFVTVDNESLIGYAIAKVYDGTAQIGPVICAEGWGKIAADLVRAMISSLKNSEISICVSGKKITLLDLLVQLGFHEEFRVIRMYYGDPLGNSCVFAAESLERG
jgi:predicted N-acetyltransferase YhbS